MGRGTPCNPNSYAFGGAVQTVESLLSLFGSRSSVTTVDRVGPKRPVDRSNPQFIVEVDGKDITRTYQRFVESIDVQEFSDHVVSKLTITFTNLQNLYGDDSIWKQGAEISVRNGYQATGLKTRGNTFVSQGPRIIYPDSGGEQKIILLAYGEEVKLMNTEERVVWRNLADHQIVEQIASKYGWSVDIEPTVPVHEHVAQVNESDWKFLDRRARYYGYQFYLDQGVLHFHRPRYRKGAVGPLVYRANKEGNLNGMTVWQTPLQHGTTMEGSQVDPLSRELFTVTSSDADDEVTQQTKASYKNGPIVSSKTLSSANGGDSYSYVLEEGHKQTRESLQTEVDGFSRYTRWLVEGEGSSVGLENLKVRDCLDFIGLGRDSGEYYIRELTTTINAKGSMSNFRVARTWRGGTRGSLLKQEPLELTQVPA